MAGGPACMVLGAVVPVRPGSTIKNHMKILCRPSKPTRKFSACLQNSHKNPLFALKTQLSLWASHRPQTRTLVAAEAIVSYIVGRVGDLLLKEAELFSGVHHLFKRIQKELEYIQPFLKDADSKQMKDPLVKKWLEETIELSYEVEDLIDDFVSSETEQRTKLGTKDVRSKSSEIRTRHNVGKELQGLKEKINDISGWIETYGIRERRQEASSSTPTPQDLRRYNAQVVEEPEVVGLQDEINNLKRQLRTLVVEEPEVVGLQEEINNLNQQLRNEVRRQRLVIPIVGMAGSGKTTLAKKVYDAVKDDFECHAFHCLSQQYEIKDVFMSLIKCVMDLPRDEEERMAQLNEKELGEKLRDQLTNRRYLVVIDDIWSKEAWDEMLEPILPNDVGSKSVVILTTRKEDVVPNSPHLQKKRLLNDDEAWELLIKQIFAGENPSTVCPSELEETGRKILAACKGLPLAILALGGALANKKDLTWSEVLESVNNFLTESPERCMDILAWSFWELPRYLKPCFLYFGLFPEDYEIDSKKIINLWIAEGFIQQSDNKIMEEVAEQYLKELVSRSMIQASGYMSDGSIAKCRIHDLLRQLSISKARENNFFTIHDVDGTHSFPDTMLPSVRRLALHRNIDWYHPTKNLRSLLNFCNFDVSQLELRDAKFMRVVSGLPLTEEVKEFAQLRYLELSGGESLLSSIGSFNNLQTLIVDQSDTPLPNAVSNLKQLRHLAAIGNGEEGNLAVNNLTNLRTLCLRTGSWLGEGFGKLTNLRKLEISGNIEDQYHKALSDSIDKLKNLRSLSLLSGSHIPPFLSLRLHSHLYQMSLDGRIEKLPELPPYLAELALSNSNLQQDAISKLEKLPHLKILRITNEPNLSKKVTFSSEGFRQLELLELIRLPEEWVIEKGAMPSLKGVLLHEMPDHLKAETLPERVRVLLKQYYSIKKRNTA